jgi:hypothetical protein
LLTALSTAIEASHKSWYYAHLTRRLYQTEQEGWNVAKNMVLAYIELQATARHSRTLAVRALANDVEIVVDPAEAYANNMTIR